MLLALGMERPLAPDRGVFDHPASPQSPRLAVPRSGRGARSRAGTWAMADGMLRPFLISPSATYRSQSATSCHGPASVGQRAGVRGGFVHCPHWGPAAVVSEALCINRTSPPGTILSSRPPDQHEDALFWTLLTAQLCSPASCLLAYDQSPTLLDAQVACISAPQRAVAHHPDTAIDLQQSTASDCRSPEAGFCGCL